MHSHASPPLLPPSNAPWLAFRQALYVALDSLFYVLFVGAMFVLGNRKLSIFTWGLGMLQLLRLVGKMNLGTFARRVGVGGIACHCSSACFVRGLSCGCPAGNAVREICGHACVCLPCGDLGTLDPLAPISETLPSSMHLLYLVLALSTGEGIREHGCVVGSGMWNVGFKFSPCRSRLCFRR